MKILFIIPGASSFGAMVALEWLGEPYQIGVTTKEIRDSNAYRKINPLGKVGALLDGDILVYENLAILLYLADQNPQSKIAIPLNSQKRTQTYIWLSYIISTIHVAFGPLFSPNTFVDATEIEIFKAKIIQKIRNIFTYVNNYLATNKYFVGDGPTIVDAHAYGILRWSEKIGILNEFTHIKIFIERMGELQAVRNALNIEQQKTNQLVDSTFEGFYIFQ